VNTILLLSSGVTITLAHRAMLKNTNFNITEKFDKHMFVTIILGVTFLYCQGIEYKYGITFRWKENIYGSTFFATTGFHGLHVTIGTIFLLFCLLRNQITSLVASVVTSVTNNWMQDVYLACYHKFETYRKGLENMYQRINETFKDLLKWEPRLSEFRMTKNQHLGFEAAAWYWHFVDIVWIFLFITIYWWGN
jgi:cytochrome c oxidase subunit 3